MHNLSYTEYSIITESLDSDVGEVKRDTDLETMAKFSLPSNVADSVQALYTDAMDDNNLRLIKLKNSDGDIEYHVHNQTMMSGKSGNESKRGFLHALKIIHDDAKDELAKGNRIILQSLSNDQHSKYKLLAHRIAIRNGRTVKNGGLKPFTSNPFVKGPTLVIE